MEQQVFISYKRENEPFSLSLRDQLQDWKYPTWRDVDEIPPDSPSWADDIQRGLESSDIVIGVATTLAMGSENVKAEWDWAIMNGRRLILLWMEDCKWHHQYIRRQRIDFRDGHDAGFEKLRKALQQPSDDTAPDDRYSDYLTAFYNRTNRILRGTLLYTLAEKHDPKPLDLITTTAPEQVITAKRVEIDPFETLVGLAEEPQTTFDSFETAFTQFDGRVLLLGNPGAGKTTTLLHYAQNAALRRRDDLTEPLPILANIALWDSQTPLAQWLQGSYGAPADVAGLLAGGKALLLLDGLDELGSSRTEKRKNEAGEEEEVTYDPRLRFMQAVNTLVDSWSAEQPNRILITSRVADYQQIGHKIDLSNALQLQPLSDDQLATALIGHPELLAAIREDTELADLFKTPLIMSLFAFAWDEIPAEKRSAMADRVMAPGDVRDTLLEAFIRKRYAFETNRLKLRGAALPFTYQEMMEVLGELALWNAQQQRPGKSYGDDDWRPEDNVLIPDDLSYVIKDEDRVQAFKRMTTQLNILAPANESDYRFVHLLLRDFLAYTFALPRLHDKAFWREVFFGTADPAVALGTIKDRRAVEPLLGCLGDDASDVRGSAAMALGKIGEPAVEPLIGCLGDADADVRRYAAGALGKIGEPAVEPLIGCLGDDDSRVRVSAAAALGDVGDPRAVKPLIGCLGDEHWRVRRDAARALGRIGDADVRVSAALGEIGELAVEPLIGCLGDDASDVRGSAARALGEISDVRAVEPLIGCLGDEDEDVRRSAAAALGRIGDPRAVESLIGCLGDADEDVRGSAAGALERIGEPAVEPLIGCLGHADGDVRGSAAGALRRIGEPAVEPLIGCLGDDNPRVRVSAAVALGKIGEPAVEPLIVRLGDESASVRALATVALSQIDNPRAAQAVMPLLNDFAEFDYEDETYRVCDVAYRALRAIGTADAQQACADWVAAGNKPRPV